MATWSRSSPSSTGSTTTRTTGPCNGIRNRRPVCGRTRSPKCSWRPRRPSENPRTQWREGRPPDAEKKTGRSADKEKVRREDPAPLGAGKADVLLYVGRAREGQRRARLVQLPRRGDAPRLDEGFREGGENPAEPPRPTSGPGGGGGGRE